MSKNVMTQGNVNQDSLELLIGFTDGDGDIGLDPQEQGINLIVTDNRTGQTYANYKVPSIPSKGANNGVDGKMYIKLYSTCCIFTDGTRPCEISPTTEINKLTMDIHLTDRAGNKSNVITTDSLQLICQ